LEREPWLSTYDRELDTAPRPTSELSGEAVEADQRLLANPFLAVMNLGIVFALLRAAVQYQILVLFLIGMVLLPAPIFLLQFHCLDCGATGWLLGHRRHICPSVMVRRQERRRRRFRGPGLKAQTLAWFFVLAAVFVWRMIVSIARR
jgi:hypothetical protein